TAAYYIWAMQRAIFGPLNARWKDLEDAHSYETVPLAVLCALFAIFGILPFLLLDMTIQWAARALGVASVASIAVFLPEISLVFAALTSAILGFVVGRRTQILWVWALVTLLAAMFLTLDMMGLGVTRLLGLNLYEVPVSGVGGSGDFASSWKLRVDTFTLFFH